MSFDAHICPCYPMTSHPNDAMRRQAGKANSGSMVQFLGTHQNRLDAKGASLSPRRSAPRSGHADGEANGTHLVLRPSHQHPCIEAWPSA